MPASGSTSPHGPSSGAAPSGGPSSSKPSTSASTAKAQKAGPVEVRSMSSPKPGWTIEAAVQLLDDGYSAEQVERMTGFDARHVSAAAAAAAKANKPPGHGVVRPPEPVRRPEPAREVRQEPALPESEPETAPSWPRIV